MNRGVEIFVIICGMALLAPHSSIASQIDDKGFVCIAPIPAPNDSKRSLANPSGGGSHHEYSIQIDKSEILQLPFDSHVAYPPIGRVGRHLVIIRDQKTIVQSFWFTFDSFKTARLCLWQKSLYETWSLWDQSDSAHLCQCKYESPHNQAL